MYSAFKGEIYFSRGCGENAVFETSASIFIIIKKEKRHLLESVYRIAF
jgi:hypothetical protein